jgi:signal peptidase
MVAAVLLLGYAGWQVVRAARERSARATEQPVVVGSGVVDGGGPDRRVDPAKDGGAR